MRKDERRDMPGAIPESDVHVPVVGGDFPTADHVRPVEDCVELSDIDFIGDHDGIIDLDAKVSNGRIQALANTGAASAVVSRCPSNLDCF